MGPLVVGFQEAGRDGVHLRGVCDGHISLMVKTGVEPAFRELGKFHLYPNV